MRGQVDFSINQSLNSDNKQISFSLLELSAMFLRMNFLYISWIISLTATLGSLFFSEVMDFEPCRLCWYQRILMYPLVLIFFIGVFDCVKNAFKYSKPFILLGIALSFYHLLIQWGVVPESLSPCVQGISCSAYYIKWLGFITIPLLSFSSFTLLLLFQILGKIKNEIE